MALEVKLVERDDLSVVDTSALALTDFTNGIALRREAWIQQIANTQQPIAESLQLTLKGATATPDALATVAQALDAKVTAINDSKRNAAHGVWLRTRAGETNDRQAFITAVPDKRAANVHGVKAITQGIAEGVPFAFTRMPYWEATTKTDIAISTAADVPAGQTNLFGIPLIKASPAGDVPARAAKLVLTPAVSGVDRLWIGFCEGGATDQPNLLWECEAGDLYNSTSAIALGASSGYSGNSIARCTFADASMLLRCAAKPNVLYTLPRGTYQVLLRARVTDGTTQCMVRLADGYSSDSAFSYRNRVLVSGSNAIFYQLGTINYSPAFNATYDLLYYYRLFVEASRVAGAGNLEMDCLALVPMTDGYIFVDGIGSTTNAITIHNLPDNRWEANLSTASRLTKLVSVAADGGVSVNAATGILMQIVGDRTTSSVMSDTVSGTLSVYPRYRTLRGAA